jgi:hypothetical protein
MSVDSQTQYDLILTTDGVNSFKRSLIFCIFYPPAASEWLKSKMIRENDLTNVLLEYRKNITDVNLEQHILKIETVIQTKLPKITSIQHNRSGHYVNKIWTHATFSAFDLLIKDANIFESNQKTNIGNEVHCHNLVGELFTGELTNITIKYDNDTKKQNIIEWIQKIYAEQLNNTNAAAPVALYVGEDDYDCDEHHRDTYRVIVACDLNTDNEIRLNVVYFPYRTQHYSYTLRFCVFAVSLITQFKMFHSYDHFFPNKYNDLKSNRLVNKLFEKIIKLKDRNASNNYVLGLCLDVVSTGTDVRIILDFDYVKLFVKFIWDNDLIMHDCFALSGSY